MHRLVVIILTIIGAELVCCTSPTLLGEYDYSRNLVYHRLELLSDSTFSFNATGDLMNSDTKGTWDINGDTLVLTSFDSYLPYKVLETIESDSTTIVSLSDTDGIVFNSDYVEIDSDKGAKYFVDAEGMIHLSNKVRGFNEMYIATVAGNFTYKRQNPAANMFRITYHSELMPRLYFNESRFVIHGNKLHDIERTYQLKKIREHMKE